MTMPPTVAALGYLSWFQGQYFYCNSLMKLSDAPEFYSWTSNASGIAAVIGVYYVQSTVIFPLLETSTQKEELGKHALQRRPHHLTKISTQAQTGYVPPESMTELAKKVGPPLMLRVAATSIAFFAAGMIQTHVANMTSPPEYRR